MGVQDAADIRMVGVHRGVHGDHGALDRRQVALKQRPIQPYPHHHGGWVVAQGGARGEIHLLGPWDANTDIAVPVRGDRAAGDHPLSDVGNLAGQLRVHDEPSPGSNTPDTCSHGARHR